MGYKTAQEFTLIFDREKWQWQVSTQRKNKIITKTANNFFEALKLTAAMVNSPILGQDGIKVKVIYYVKEEQ